MDGQIDSYLRPKTIFSAVQNRDDAQDQWVQARSDVTRFENIAEEVAAAYGEGSEQYKDASVDLAAARSTLQERGTERDLLDMSVQIESLEAIQQWWDKGLAQDGENISASTLYQSMQSNRGTPLTADQTAALELLHLDPAQFRALDTAANPQTGPDGQISPEDISTRLDGLQDDYAQEFASFLGHDTKGFQALEGTDTQPGGINRKTGVLNYLLNHPDQGEQMDTLLGSDGFTQLYNSGEAGERSIDKLLRQYATDDAYRANIDKLVGSPAFQGLEGRDTEDGGVERQRGVLHYAAGHPGHVGKLAELFDTPGLGELYGRGEAGERKVDEILRAYATDDTFRSEVDTVVGEFGDKTASQQAEELAALST